MATYTKGSPWAVALVRGLIGAAATGGATVLTMWANTNDEKTLAIAFLTPVIAFLVLRFAVEGAVDNGKQEGRDEVVEAHVVEEPALPLVRRKPAAPGSERERLYRMRIDNGDVRLEVVE